MESILPSGVVAVEAFGDPPELAPHPEEAAIVAGAVDKRRREFITTRHCAREAMSRLGFAPAAVLRGTSGTPVWPRDVVGSLTHCDRYRAAVVAHAVQVRSIGIDAEPHAALPPGILGAVSLPAEREWIDAADDDVHWDRLLFCTKEATYKAWEPLTGRWLGFEDAHITFSRAPAGRQASGSFVATILIDGRTHNGPPIQEMKGTWRAHNGLVAAALVIE